MLKGVLDGIVLEIISRGEIYGYEITRRLHAMGFEGLAEATVYALLLRLEKNKLVHITKKPSEMGPPRKFYTLNERGIEELAAIWARWDFLGGRIHSLRKNGGFDHELEPGDQG
ncbi:PadR family transcriptional regulator [Paenibacillus sp. YN15]|uniref:PadR family transcriptional regulator n=1 Tax=Paenibacillus sp. YN15 TaxID=1742774 RepID=UPI000DCD8583|nr:PadR family transcriptional regulator [Paenibacillus sp. YN15]RAU91856.1 PadR family transcriptional regulator [Paenibacillus sp. YN15]